MGALSSYKREIEKKDQDPEDLETVLLEMTNVGEDDGWDEEFHDLPILNTADFRESLGFADRPIFRLLQLRLMLKQC